MTSKSNDDWIPLQIKVFSRWFEAHAKGVTDTPVNDITKDLSTGVALIELAQSLTNTKPSRSWKHNPQREYCRVQNCELALDMFKNDGIKFVGISGKDIADNNQKLILGFIWSLILHYSISKYISNETNEKSNGSTKNSTHELLEWAIKRTANYPNIANFQPLDMAFCALLDSYAPDKVQFSTLDPKDVEHNLKHAANVMTDLGIPLYVYPEEVYKHNNQVDDKTLLIQLAAIKAIIEHQIPGLNDQNSSDSEEEIKPGSEIEFLLAEKEKANAEIEQLKKELEQAKLALQGEKEIEEKQLKNNEKLKQTMNKIRDQSTKIFDSLSTFQKDMNAKINDESQRIDNLGKQVKSYESSIKEHVENEKSRSISDINSLHEIEKQNLLAEIEKAKQIALERSNNVCHAMTTLQRDINAKIDDDLSRSDKLNQATQTNNKAIEDEIANYQNQIQNYIRVQNNYQQQIIELTQNLTESKKQIDSQQKEYADLLTLKTKEDSDEDKMKKNIDNLQNEKDAAEENVEEITKMNDEEEISKPEVDEKDKLIQNLRNENESLKKDKQEAENKVAEMIAILTDIKQMTAEHDKYEQTQISQLRQQIARQQERIKKDDIELDHLNKALVEKSQINSTLIIRPRNADTKDSQNIDDQKLEELRNQLKSKDKEIQQLESENEKYRIKQANMQNQFDKLYHKINATHDSNVVDISESDESQSNRLTTQIHKHHSHRNAYNDEEIYSSSEEYDAALDHKARKKQAKKNKKESLALKERKIKAEAQEKMNRIAVIRAKAETKAEKVARLHADSRCKSVSELYLRTQKRETRKPKITEQDFNKMLKKEDK